MKREGSLKGQQCEFLQLCKLNSAREPFGWLGLGGIGRSKAVRWRFLPGMSLVHSTSIRNLQESLRIYRTRTWAFFSTESPNFNQQQNQRAGPYLKRGVHFRIPRKKGLELLPLSPSLGSTLHPPPLTSLCQSTVYTDSVQLGGVGGALSRVGDHIPKECNTPYLTRFRTYKIARPPQTKTQEGGGLRQINTCRKVPLQVNFFR